VRKQLDKGLTVNHIKAELAFLRRVDSQPILYSESVVRRAIYR
jgi:hypothetical protein